MKLKFTLLVTMIFGLMSLTINSAMAQDDIAQPETVSGPKLKIVSGFKGGSYYQMAKDMQKMTRSLGEAQYTEQTVTDSVIDPETNEKIAQDKTIKVPTGDTIEFLEVRESDGSYYNFLKIDKSDVDLTFLQYDVLLMEDEKDLQRKLKKVADIRILLPFGAEQIHLITTKNGKIKSFDDLKNKRVGIGSKLQGTNVTALYIKEQTKMKWEDVEIPYDKAFRALFNGDIDAFFFVGKAPVSDLANLSKTMKDKITLISLPVNEKLKDAYGEQIDITMDQYKWLEANVKTYQVKTVLVTSIRDQDPAKVEAIKELLRAIKENKDKAGFHPGWANVVFEEDPAIEFQYHPMMKEI